MCCVALLGAPAVCCAQPEDAPAADARLYDFPFDFSSGKIFVDVMVNGRGPYPFAIDTGSPPTVIDSDLAKDLGLSVMPMGQVGGAGEGSTPVAAVQGVALEFGGITLPARSMMGAALNRTLAPFNGRPVMGLIGNDFVSARVVQIDYAAERIRVFEGAWEYSGAGVAVPTRTAGYTFLRGSVTPTGGEPIAARFMIDSGAGLAASLTTPFVNKHHLLGMHTPMFETTVGFGLGGEVRHRVCRLPELKMGEVTIAEPVVTLSQDRGGALAMRQFDVLIGGEILSKFTVTFDGPGHRMILEKNGLFPRPIEFDMSGLTLIGDGGRLKVMRVLDGSPVADAGVREGDVVLAIDGREFRESDRDEARRALRAGDDAERTLRLRRDDREFDVRIRLKKMVAAPARYAPARAVAWASHISVWNAPAAAGESGSAFSGGKRWV